MMERFTKKTENGNVIELRRGHPKWTVAEGGDFSELRYTISGSAIDRLGAYEDTGLTPGEALSMKMDMAIINAMFQNTEVERMKELAEADKDGRLIVLPCKAGDTVWFMTYDQNGTVNLGIQPHEVVSTRAFVVSKGRYTDVGISVEQFGKTAFLTREEAEAALKEAENDG